MDSSNKNYGSQPIRPEVSNSLTPTHSASEEIRTLQDNIEEPERRHGVDQGKPQKHIESLEEKLTSENLELSRGLPVPYGSYCSSGATPQLLHQYSGKVLIGLGNFVLFSVPIETTIENANSLKARVSKIFFSKFEQIDFGVKVESPFTDPGLLSEQSLTEFRAFVEYADDPEDEAVKPYMRKYMRFLDHKKAKIQNLTCGEFEWNEASHDHFKNLAMNVWMLHKLTLSFERANVRLMRAVHDEPFNDKFMEPVGEQDEDRLKGKPPATTTTVKHVILPGLWVNNSVIKCRVCVGSATGQEPSTAPAPQLRGCDAGNGMGPQSVDVTQDRAHQPTSSQVPDGEAPAAYAHDQQTQAMEYTSSDEPHVSGASHPQLADEELGNEKTLAVEVDQAAQEMTNMDITNSPLEELEQEPSLQRPHPTPMMENYGTPGHL